MKLLYCMKCHDVVRLLEHERHCYCGSTGGHYINQLDAVFWGDGIPIGFENRTLSRALENQPEGPGLGKRFEAFVIPKTCPTMTKIDPTIPVHHSDEPFNAHTRHCCVVHGCKYKHHDCTVTTKQATQEGPCETCRLELEGHYGEEGRIHAANRWPGYVHMEVDTLTSLGDFD